MNDQSSVFDQTGDMYSKVQYDLISQNRICQMSDVQSFKSNNVGGQIEGFKKKVELIKLRQSTIYNQSYLAGPGVVSIPDLLVDAFDQDEAAV